MDASALFKSYEADYCNRSTDASRKISSLEGLNGDARRRKVQEIESDLRSAEDVIKRMDLEARSLPAEQSKPLQLNVKNYKADLAALKEQVKKAAAALPAGDAARAELGLGGDYLSSSAGQRDRMLTATQRMEKTNDTLKYGQEQLIQTEMAGIAVLEELHRQRQQIQNAQRTLQDTDKDLSKGEELGASILRDLHGQRQTIISSKQTLEGADDNITKARKILSNMSKVMLQNKIIMAGVIIFLLLGIALIIWAKLK